VASVGYYLEANTTSPNPTAVNKGLTAWFMKVPQYQMSNSHVFTQPFAELTIDDALRKVAVDKCGGLSQSVRSGTGIQWFKDMVKTNAGETARKQLEDIFQNMRNPGQISQEFKFP